MMRARAAPVAGVKSVGGFSLLEVLVAFTILALVLGALFQVFAGGARAARLGEEYSRAAILAESKLESLAVEDTLSEGADSGRFDDIYEWRTTVGPYEWDGQLERRGRQVLRPLVATVEVMWGDERARRSISLTSLRVVTER